MARIAYPSTPIDWALLFAKIKARHDADLLTSVLIPYLDENEIDMAEDASAMGKAMDADTKFSKAEKDSEKFSKERDNLFIPAFGAHKKCVQFLKALKNKNINTLGDWGVTVTGGSKISYAPDFTGKVVEIQNFIAKHNTFAVGTSPIQPFLDQNNIDLAQNLTDIDDAVTANNNFATADTEKETKREERDNKLNAVIDHIRGIGGYLIKLFTTNPRKAGDWGYTINTSDQGTVEKTVIIKEGATKKFKGVLIGGILYNTGTVAVSIVKDTVAGSSPITLAAGSSMVITQGFSKINITNTSSTAKATINITVHK